MSAGGYSSNICSRALLCCIIFVTWKHGSTSSQPWDLTDPVNMRLEFWPCFALQLPIGSLALGFLR